MSRTFRSAYKLYFRRPQTKCIISMEMEAVEELRSNEFVPSNRLKNRASLTGSIPTAWHDLKYDSREKTILGLTYRY